MVNTLLDANVPGGNCAGAILDAGHNLSFDGTPAFTNSASWNNIDPKLGPLADNGGPTLTMALLAGSPAIDAGDSAAAPPQDQRGVPRPVGVAADSGACEYGCPAPMVAYPLPGQHVWPAVIEASGTGGDIVPLAGIWYQQDDGAWASAASTNGWRNWTAALDLALGTNTLRCYAMDLSGNVSATNTVTFFYATPRLTVQTNGNGTVSPNYNGRALTPGDRYTMTARPGADSIFVNWTDQDGHPLAATPQFAFTMQTSLVLRANFMLNPFLPIKGSYAGLFHEAKGISTDSAGFLCATLTSQGRFTAKVQMPGQSYSFSGAFSPDGACSSSIPRRGLSPLAIELQLDFAGGEALAGSVSDGAWTAELTAFRAIHSGSQPGLEGSSKYTLVIPGGADAAAQPAGYGFGKLTVDNLGNLSFSGTLGEGTKVTQGSVVVGQGVWPLFSSLYGGKGLLLGWLGFTNPPTWDIGGRVSWIKLPQPSAKLYPQGFEFAEGIEAAVSAFVFTNGVRLVNWSDGVIELQGSNLSQPISNLLSLEANNQVRGTNRLSLTIATSSGLFQGKVMNPATGKAILVQGALLQKQNAGFGFFLGPTQSGSVNLGPE